MYRKATNVKKSKTNQKIQNSQKKILFSQSLKTEGLRFWPAKLREKRKLLKIVFFEA
jgi:hypothetical protein